MTGVQFVEALADALDGELQTLHIQLNKLGDRGCKARRVAGRCRVLQLCWFSKKSPSRQALEEAEQRSKTLVDLNIDDNDGEASEACGGLWGFRGFVRS